MPYCSASTRLCVATTFGSTPRHLPTRRRHSFFTPNTKQTPTTTTTTIIIIIIIIIVTSHRLYRQRLPAIVCLRRRRCDCTRRRRSVCRRWARGALCARSPPVPTLAGILISIASHKIPLYITMIAINIFEIVCSTRTPSAAAPPTPTRDPATSNDAQQARLYARDALQRLLNTVAPRHNSAATSSLLGRAYRRRFASSARARSVIDGGGGGGGGGNWPSSASVIEHDDDTASLGTFVARSESAYDEFDDRSEFTTEYTMFGDNMSVRDDAQGRRQVCCCS
jgi:hypothetical protein